ncbi:MAG: lipocalin family protein [Flavobacteriaceae bacterium]|jgi:hypothetical protein|nr:lipocalin family protein [Flavobacteriaceae bacterium]
MKKILLTALSSIVLCLSFAACSDDDDSTPASSENVILSPPNSEKLIGKWVYEKESALDADGKVVSIYFGDKCPSTVVDFKADGTLVETVYFYDDMKDVCEPDTLNGKWSINGDTFTEENKYTEVGEGISKHTIIRLSDDTFEIEAPLPKYLAGDYKPNVVKLQYILKKL